MGLPAVTVRRGLEELTSYGLAHSYPAKQGQPSAGRELCSPRKCKLLKYKRTSVYAQRSRGKFFRNLTRHVERTAL